MSTEIEDRPKWLNPPGHEDGCYPDLTRTSGGKIEVIKTRLVRPIDRPTEFVLIDPATEEEIEVSDSKWYEIYSQFLPHQTIPRSIEENARKHHKARTSSSKK